MKTVAVVALIAILGAASACDFQGYQAAVTSGAHKYQACVSGAGADFSKLCSCAQDYVDVFSSFSGCPGAAQAAAAAHQAVTSYCHASSFSGFSNMMAETCDYASYGREMQSAGAQYHACVTAGGFDFGKLCQCSRTFASVLDRFSTCPGIDQARRGVDVALNQYCNNSPASNFEVLSNNYRCYKRYVGCYDYDSTYNVCHKRHYEYKCI